MLRTGSALLAFLIATIVVRADMTTDCERTTRGGKERDAAIQACTELLAADPKNGAAYYNRGAALLLRNDPGDADRAIDDFSNAIQLDPKSAIAYRQRGEAHLARDQARRDALAGALDPRITRQDYDRLHNENVAEQNRAIAAAIADYTRALEIDATDWFTYWARGSAFRQKGDSDQMIQDFNKVLELNPQWYSAADELHVPLGIAHQKKGQYDRAIAHFTTALEKGSQLPFLVYRLRAQAYLKAGRPEEALPNIERSLALRPDDTFTLAIKREILDSLGRR